MKATSSSLRRRRASPEASPARSGALRRTAARGWAAPGRTRRRSARRTGGAAQGWALRRAFGPSGSSGASARIGLSSLAGRIRSQPARPPPQAARRSVRASVRATPVRGRLASPDGQRGDAPRRWRYPQSRRRGSAPLQCAGRRTGADRPTGGPSPERRMPAPGSTGSSASGRSARSAAPPRPGWRRSPAAGCRRPARS